MTRETKNTLTANNTDRPAALVTGAGKRIGAAIALDLAQSGWNLVLHYRHSAQAVQATKQACCAAGAECICLCTDFADEAEVKKLFADAITYFGTIDAVINSAACFEFDTVETLSYASLQQHLLSNAGAPILLANALAQHRKQRFDAGRGQNREAFFDAAVVVNLLDQKLWNLNPDFFSYTLSKSVLETANTMLAIALAPLVRVVGVAPGLTLTSNFMEPADFEKLHRLSPLGRSSTLQDIVSAVQFAIRNRAITGTTLLVDGGQHLMRFERDFSKM